MGVDNTGTLIPLVQQVWLNLAGTDVPPTHEAGFTVGPDFPDRCNDHPSDKSHIVSLVRGYFTAGNHAVEYIFGVFIAHDPSDNFLPARLFRGQRCAMASTRLRNALSLLRPASPPRPAGSARRWRI